VLPFHCRGDAADLPVLGGYTTAHLREFKADCRADSDDEERRLAYVAMTRARHQLWLSAYLWSPTRKDPMAPSPYLVEVLGLGTSAVTVEQWCEDAVDGAVNPLLADGVADHPWPALPNADELAGRRGAATMVDAARGRLALESSPSGAELVTAQRWRRDTELLLDEARRRRVRTIDVAVPARLTTSQVVALTRDEDAFAAALARPLPARPQPQARRGSRFHRWVEELHDVSPLIEPDDLPGALDEDLSDADLAALQQQFLAGGWGERRPVAVEAPFEMTVGGRMIRGRIDAVYRDEDGGYDVIDYKTGAMPHGREFEVASVQLSIYRLAWSDLAGVDPSEVSAGFLYVREGARLKRPGRLLDRGELAAVLNGS
jgi:DNA helicase-2/ATP-dependent DNA helicase PcrA